jgi:hypothetical protein
MLRKLKFIAGSGNQRTIHAKLTMALLAAAVGLSSLLPPSLDAQSDRHAVRLENDSSFAIYQVFVSPVYRQTWGYDKLGDVVLEPGYYVTLPPLRLGHYDLKLVDEDGDTCVVSNVRVDYETKWAITDSWLLGCEFHR